MDGAAAASAFGMLLQIVFLDLLLSGDNALVIALACRRLPLRQAKNAAWMGAAGAILLRVVLTLMTGELMRLPFLQLISAIPLLVIAVNLMQDEEGRPDSEPNATLARREAQNTMFAAAMLIVVSDAAMSLDNVVAVAAVAGGNIWMLAFGLGLSIPLIVFGSFAFGRLMQAYPLLVDLGAALLGWVAGGMIVGDPLFAGWAQNQAPAVALTLPLACAVFVLTQGRFARRAKTLAAKSPRPAPPPRIAEKAPARKVEPRAASRLAPPAAMKMKERTESTAAGEVLSVARQSDLQPGRRRPAPASDIDRFVFAGLIALFVFFGLFLAIFIMMPDS